MYLWIVVVGAVFALFASAGIGSNDAANSFSTSVASKSLTIKQAIIISAIFETAGAILMGSHVSDTIRKGIADYKCFEDEPYMLMYGCMWVIFSVGAWLFIASYYEMPVSTTHSCVGGMIGMTIALGGPKCVIWYKAVDTFPYIGGVGGIILSWFISPVFSGIISYIIFNILRCSVLRSDFNSKRINIMYPILIASTITINAFFIIYKGAKGLGLNKIGFGTASAISFGLGGLSFIITFPLIPKLKERISRNILERDIWVRENIDNGEKEPMNVRRFLSKEWRPEGNGNNGNENKLVLELQPINNKKELNTVKRIHTNAEKFDRKTEESFKYLQVFTAMCDSFSHGANDVANSIGPFVAIWTIYNSNGHIEKKSSMDSDAYWILGFGGLGIALGIMVYGKKIIYVIGEKLCKITPSRGVTVELSSALVIIAGSRLGIPLSTTHCQVGATIGVGLLENKKESLFSGINCRVFLKIIFGWIITCIVVGLSAGLLTAQGTYSPSKYDIIGNMTHKAY